MSRILLTAVALFFLANWLLCCGGGAPTDEQQADVLWDKGEKRLAVEIYSKAVRQNFYFRAISAERAAGFYLEQGETERAEEMMWIAVQRKVELDPQSPEVQQLYKAAKAKEVERVEKLRAKRSDESATP